MAIAARKIAELGPDAVVVKGGHAPFALATDVMFDGESVRELHPEGDVEEKSVHGSGCTFSAALAARLAMGESLQTALSNAKRYITRVIMESKRLGSGSFVITPPDSL